MNVSCYFAGVVRRFSRDEWALILGGSSGIGLASAKRLAQAGMSLAIVHRDRRASLPDVEAAFDEVRRLNMGFRSFNLDALAPESQKQVLSALLSELGHRSKVRVLLHSIAWGNLKPLAPDDGPALDDEDFAHTVHAMGTSLATWTRALHQAGLFAADARVLGLSSEGSQLAWPGYAAVSAAKAALEAVSRAIAVEYARHGIRSNIVQAGVTDTPALRKLPESARLAERALRRNPLGRLTRPEDVAGAVYLLASDEAAWINGAILRVDGGEQIAG